MSEPIGQLRHRVQIEKRTDAQDGHGQLVPTWARVDTVWAKVSPGSGREFVEAQAINAKLTHVVVMRRWPELTTTHHRLRFGTRIFAIESIVNEDERDRWFVVMAAEDKAEVNA